MSGEQRELYVENLEASHAQLLDLVETMLFAPYELTADQTQQAVEAVRMAKRARE